MKSGDGYVQAYNCQAIVDDAYQIIVAEAVTNQPPDVEHLVAMIARTVENCGKKPAKLVADAGYFSEANVCETMKWGIDPYIATGRNSRSGCDDASLGFGAILRVSTIDDRRGRRR